MADKAFTNTQLALIKALKHLCKPLVRLLIEKGISFVQFRDLLKGLYVEVASESFALDNERPSDSRIYVLTGVHRKDIKRLREASQDETTPESAQASLSGEIIARWNSLEEYTDERGKPSALLLTAKGGDAGFDQLVRSVSKDVRPRVVLEEWQRLKLVRVKADRVCLNQSAFIARKDFKEQAYYLDHHIHDHLASCVNNILQESQPMLERSVYYAGLTAQSVETLRTMASKKGNDLLQLLNKQAMSLHQADKDKPGAQHRIRLGVYWYDAQTHSTPENNAAKQIRRKS